MNGRIIVLTVVILKDGLIIMMKMITRGHILAINVKRNLSWRGQNEHLIYRSAF